MLAYRTTKTVDQTLVSGSTGVDVVDACVQKLNTIKSLSNDFGLIKRIAYVESEFGTLTGVGNNAGGIWRVNFYSGYTILLWFHYILWLLEAVHIFLFSAKIFMFI